MINPKIYYSDKCKYCKELLNFVKSSNIIIELVNIDYNDYPKDQVFSVPTLIAPDLVKPLVGKSVFDWVKNQQFFNSQSNNINLSKKIVFPKQSDLLKKEFNNTLPQKEKFCSINESTNLLI